MTVKFLIIVFVMTTVLLGTGAGAQQSAKIPRIGLIEVSATTAADRVQAFRPRVFAIWVMWKDKTFSSNIDLERAS
jgi:uncharacterized protein (DUF1684 family)